MIGFNSDTDDSTNIYDIFVGKTGCFGAGNVTSTGVLKEINIKEGYMLIQPSLVGIGGTVTGKQRIRIDYESPTIIGIPEGAPISMRPLQPGDLETMSTEENKGIIYT
jgi:hypothetical protein